MDYTVIMIITDGGISDMAETKAALVALSKKPVSVVLVSFLIKEHIRLGVEQRRNRKFDPEAEISVSGSNFRFL